MRTSSHSRPSSAQPINEIIANGHKALPGERKPRQGQELRFKDNEQSLGNEKTTRVSADHYQKSGNKVAPTNHKESYQLERFDDCQRNRQDQEGLVRAKAVEETVNGAGNSHRSSLALDHNTVAARSFVDGVRRLSKSGTVAEKHRPDRRTASATVWETDAVSRASASRGGSRAVSQPPNNAPISSFAPFKVTRGRPVT